MCPDKEGKQVKYTTVHIPNALAVIIDKLIEDGEFAYSSRSEFVKDALRRFLEYHGYYPQTGISLEKTKITVNPSLTDDKTDKTIADLNARIKMFQDLKDVLSDRKNHEQ
jgi:hypothetical protein